MSGAPGGLPPFDGGTWKKLSQAARETAQSVGGTFSTMGRSVKVSWVQGYTMLGEMISSLYRRCLGGRGQSPSEQAQTTTIHFEGVVDKPTTQQLPASASVTPVATSVAAVKPVEASRASAKVSASLRVEVINDKKFLVLGSKQAGTTPVLDQQAIAQMKALFAANRDIKGVDLSGVEIPKDQVPALLGIIANDQVLRFLYVEDCFKGSDNENGLKLAVDRLLSKRLARS